MGINFLKVPGNSNLSRLKNDWNSVEVRNDFKKSTYWLFTWQRGLHFCFWITAARLPVAMWDFLSPALITRCLLFVHIVSSSSENHSACSTWRKSKTDGFFLSLSTSWKLNDNDETFWTAECFLWPICFLSTERYLQIFERCQKSNFLKRILFVILHPCYKKTPCFSLLGASFSIVLPGVSFLLGAGGSTQCPLLEGNLNIVAGLTALLMLNQKINIYICEAQPDSLQDSFLDMGDETPPSCDWHPIRMKPQISKQLVQRSRWRNFWSCNFYVQVLI